MKIHLIRELATVALLIGSIFSTQAQDWSSMNMVISSNHGNNNCHRVDRNYNFSYSIQLPPPTSVMNSCGGNDTEEYTLTPSGGNDPVVVFDANGQSSLYRGFQRQSSIDKGSGLNSSFTAKYDESWRATKMSFTLVVHVRYVEKRECTDPVTGQKTTDVLRNQVYAREVTVDFPIGRYFAAPQSISIDGSSSNIISVDPTRGCATYTLTAPSINHVDEYRWILPNSSWLTSGSASLNTQTITIRPGHGNNLGNVQLEVTQNCDGPRSKVATFPVRVSVPSISLNQAVACESNYTTVASLPPFSSGVSANWQVDGSRIEIISNQGNTLRFRARGNYQQTTTIRATIQSACGSTTTASRTIWLGKPTQPITDPSGYPTIQIPLNSFTNLLVDNHNPLELASYQWWATSNGIRMQPSGTFCRIWGDAVGHHNYYVARTNACGISLLGGGAVQVGGSSGGGPGGGIFAGPRNSSLSDLNPEARITRLMLTPNPANDVVNLTFQDDAGDLIDWAGMQAALLDVSGRQIATIQSTTYDISNLAAGVYFIQIDTPKGKLVEKLIVQ